MVSEPVRFSLDFFFFFNQEGFESYPLYICESLGYHISLVGFNSLNYKVGTLFSPYSIVSGTLTGLFLQVNTQKPPNKYVSSVCFDTLVDLFLIAYSHLTRVK